MLMSTVGDPDSEFRKGGIAKVVKENQGQTTEWDEE